MIRALKHRGAMLAQPEQLGQRELGPRQVGIDPVEVRFGILGLEPIDMFRAPVVDTQNRRVEQLPVARDRNKGFPERADGQCGDRVPLRSGRYLRDNLTGLVPDLVAVQLGPTGFRMQHIVFTIRLCQAVSVQVKRPGLAAGRPEVYTEQTHRRFNS
jgi:hypothetical protein